MIYGKLSVVFLTTLASEPSSSTNHHIAKVILEQINDFKNISIVDLAQLCNVGTGSISRFCKDIGLQGFSELKELLCQSDEDAMSQPSSNEELASQISDAIHLAVSSVRQSDLNNITSDIHYYSKIYAVGLLKAQNAAIDLQTDFYTIGKQIETSYSYKEQLDHIMHAEYDELILIFSYTGSYFEYDQELKKANKHARIWMITGNPNMSHDLVDKTLYFKSMQNRQSHPYQLEAIESLIFHTYQNRYIKKDTD